MSVQPFVSAIIPVREIGYHIIFENLPQLAKQTYKNFEVIILPNQHTQYDLELLKKYPFLRIIPTGKITRPALKRNLGVQEAKGEIIAFIDDDAYPSVHWLERAVRFFKDKRVEAVCGPGIVPPEGNNWEHIFDYVLQSWIGSGGYAYRFVEKAARYVDDYPSMNFLIKKKIFEELGGFNNDFWSGEDSKLCEDIVYKKQGKIFYHPEILIYHHRRNNVRGYLRQHASYGYHRGAFFAHGDKNSRRIGYIIPTLFVLYISSLIIVSFLPLHETLLTMMFVPLAAYTIICMYQFFTTLIKSRRILPAVGSVFVLVLTHVVYGIMFVKGALKGLTHKEKIYD